jgi:hypothetical protein
MFVHSLAQSSQYTHYSTPPAAANRPFGHPRLKLIDLSGLCVDYCLHGLIVALCCVQHAG